MNTIASLRAAIHCGAVLCLALFAGLACALERPTDPILRIEPGEHVGRITSIATNAAGRWLITAADDKSVGVWDLRNGNRVTTLRVPLAADGFEGMPYAVALSPDGNTVAVGGFIGWQYESVHSIYLFDRNTGRVLRRFTGLPPNAKTDGVIGMPNVVRSLAFSADGRILAATLGSGAGIRIFTVADGRLLATERPGPGSSVDLSGDGRLVTTSWDGIRLYRIDAAGQLTLVTKQATLRGKEPNSVRFSPDGKRVAVGFLDAAAVDVLDGNDLSALYSPDTNGVTAPLLTVAWLRDGAILYAAGKAEQGGRTFIRRWAQSGRGDFEDWPLGTDTIYDIAALPAGRIAFSTGSTWGVVGANGETLVSKEAVIADFRGDAAALKLSPDGSKVQFSYERSGKSPAVFDTTERRFLTAVTSDLQASIVSAPGIVVTDWENGGNPSLNGVRLTKSNTLARSLAISPNGQRFAIGSDFLLHVWDANGKGGWVAGGHGPSWAVNISRDNRWVVAAFGDGTIRWYRASDGVEQLALYAHPDRRRWVLWSPGGYYDAAPGSEDFIGWHVNRGADEAADFFPASRFRSRFYRPDVIAGILKSGSEAEALRLASQETGRQVEAVPIVQALPPVVEILSPQNGTTFTQPSVTLRVAVRTAADAPASAMRVRVNGLLQPEVKAAAAGDARDITVVLPAADSEIQVFAENRNGTSTPATVRLSFAGAKPQPGGTTAGSGNKPRLFVLAVGVSKYKNPRYNLDLAAKDARDFSNALAQQKGLAYRDVEVKLLTDADASKEKVLSGMEWLRTQVTPGDIAILYVAGHGVNDPANNYYFLPHDTDVAQLARTGVAHNDIKATLANIVGKALFFIDTCHSGNALGNAKGFARTDVNAMVSDLASAENGAVVYTAATGKQLSLEDEAWGNGAFTKALVEGLNGKADFRHNGQITHKGLDYYVSDRVVELTKGEQSPVSISPQGVTDFPIAILKN